MFAPECRMPQIGTLLFTAVAILLCCPVMVSGEEFKLSECPDSVQKTIERELDGGSLAEIVALAIDDDTLYEVDIILDDHEYELHIRADGLLVHKRLEGPAGNNENDRQAADDHERGEDSDVDVDDDDADDAKNDDGEDDDGEKVRKSRKGKSSQQRAEARDDDDDDDGDSEKIRKLRKAKSSHQKAEAQDDDDDEGNDSERVGKQRKHKSRHRKAEARNDDDDDDDDGDDDDDDDDEDDDDEDDERQKDDEDEDEDD